MTTKSTRGHATAALFEGGVGGFVHPQTRQTLVKFIEEGNVRNPHLEVARDDIDRLMLAQRYADNVSPLHVNYEHPLLKPRIVHTGEKGLVTVWSMDDDGKMIGATSKNIRTSYKRWFEAVRLYCVWDGFHPMTNILMVTDKDMPNVFWVALKPKDMPRQKLLMKV